jgi:Eukaryotic initiation factor 4E
MTNNFVMLLAADVCCICIAQKRALIAVACDCCSLLQDFHLFKEGIKPAWEDSHNSRGGLWMVRLKKGLASRYIVCILSTYVSQIDSVTMCCALRKHTFYMISVAKDAVHMKALLPLQ